MNLSNVQNRAVQALVRRVSEFRNFLLNSSGDSWNGYQFTSSVAYGSWDLGKCFPEAARVGDPVELYGSTEMILASTIDTLKRCQTTLSHNHVDFQFARLLLVHTARPSAAH